MLLWCTASPPAWAGQNTLFLLGAHDISPIVLNLPADPTGCFYGSRAAAADVHAGAAELPAAPPTPSPLPPPLVGRPDGNLAKGVSDILATLKRETPFKAEE